MKIHPLGNSILAKRNKTESTEKGIILPDSAREKKDIIKVVSVGPGKTTENGTLIPMHVQVGDSIWINAYNSPEIKIDGEDHIMIAEDEILAIIE